MKRFEKDIGQAKAAASLLLTSRERQLFSLLEEIREVGTIKNAAGLLCVLEFKYNPCSGQAIRMRDSQQIIPWDCRVDSSYLSIM